MATYIDLDSFHRNFQGQPNSASYKIYAEQVKTWNRAARQVNAHSSRPGSRAVEFSQSIQCKHVTLPYTEVKYVGDDGTVQTTHTADLQRLYLDVHNDRYNDKHLINTIDNKVPKGRFALTSEGVQYDSGMNPKWVKFSSRMDQVIRFSRNEALEVNIMQEDGKTIIIEDAALTPTPPTAPALTKELQTWILLELVPYYRDGDYNNHSLGLTQF